MEDKIVVYDTFDDSIKANIILAKLKSEGIECFLSDENMVSTYPLLSIATGGIKLNVFEKDIEQIQSILNEENIIEQDDEGKVKCPQCNSSNVAFGYANENKYPIIATIISVLFFVFPFFANKKFHCFSCGFEFKKD